MAQHSEWNLSAMLASPMLEPLHPVLGRIARMAQEGEADAAAFPSLALCNALLDAHHPPIRVQRGMRLRFVAQGMGALPFDAQYEPRCYLAGELQTRENNWHDLFNALVWLTFPRAKAAINALHYHALAEGALAEGALAEGALGGGVRGGARDMLTLLDESGVIVPCADEELAALLRDFRWKDLFWRARERLAAGMGFCVFGHGLCEKILRPYIGMTGQGLILSVDPGYFRWPLEQRLAHLDERLAAYLTTPGLAARTGELNPVPLLGVPGWSPDSGNERFYDNERYFRPSRRGGKHAPA